MFVQGCEKRASIRFVGFVVVLVLKPDVFTFMEQRNNFAPGIVLCFPLFCFRVQLAACDWGS